MMWCGGGHRPRGGAAQAPRPCKAHCFVPITAWPGTLASQTMNRFHLCWPRLGAEGLVLWVRGQLKVLL